MAPGIATLLRMMPDGYEEACFSTGAIVRKRDIKSPGTDTQSKGRFEDQDIYEYRHNKCNVSFT